MGPDRGLVLDTASSQRIMAYCPQSCPQLCTDRRVIDRAPADAQVHVLPAVAIDGRRIAGVPRRRAISDVWRSSLLRARKGDASKS